MPDSKLTALTSATTPLVGSESVYLAQSGSKKVSVDGLTTGRNVPANGIVFPATQVPSADANTLDDYEEGTWTPVLNFGGSHTGMTGTFTGKYTKIGNLIFIDARIALTAKGSSTGGATIDGLPFFSAVYPAAIADPSSTFSGLVAGGAVFGSVSGTTLYLLQQTTTGRTPATNSIFANDSDLRIAITIVV